MTDEERTEVIGQLEEQLAVEARTVDDYREALRAAEAERDKAYRERAQLVAFLAACYPSEMTQEHERDPWPIVYVLGPAGQMSWQIARADLRLFDHVGWHGDEPMWDGHTTDEKYERLARLIPRATDDRDLLATIRERLTALIAQWRDTAAQTAERQGTSAAHAAYLRAGSDAIKACADALAELLET